MKITPKTMVHCCVKVTADIANASGSVIEATASGECSDIQDAIDATCEAIDELEAVKQALKEDLAECQGGT